MLNNLNSPQLKYRIHRIIQEKFRGKNIRIRQRVCEMLGIKSAEFNLTASSETSGPTKNLFFTWGQLQVIAIVLRVHPDELHEAPLYRILDVINSKPRPDSFKARIFRALIPEYYKTQKSIREKWTAHTGNRNRLTIGELSIIATILDVSVDELYHQPESVEIANAV